MRLKKKNFFLFYSMSILYFISLLDGNWWRGEFEIKNLKHEEKNYTVINRMAMESWLTSFFLIYKFYIFIFIHKISFLWFFFRSFVRVRSISIIATWIVFRNFTRMIDLFIYFSACWIAPIINFYSSSIDFCNVIIIGVYSRELSLLLLLVL